MKEELVKINPQDFGLEDSVASGIASQFQPMLDKMVELEAEYNEVIALPIEEPATAKKAREVRLKYMKIRTGTVDIHKKQKAFYLAGGRFVDGWKNAQEFASLGKEKALEDIEKYAENLEKERIKQLQLDRQNQLMPYEVENLETLNLGKMADNVWENFLQGAIVNFNAKKEAEKLAEIAEQERLEAERLEREKVRIENEKLKAEAAAKELLMQQRGKELQPYIIFIMDYNALINLSEEEYQVQFNEIKVGAEQHWEFERKEQIRKQQEEEVKQKQLEKEMLEAEKARQEAAKLLEAEKAKAKAIAEELEKQKQAAAKLEEEKQAALELELSKGDGDKMKSLINDLADLTTKYSFKSKKHKALQSSINELINKTVVFAQSKL